MTFLILLTAVAVSCAAAVAEASSRAAAFDLSGAIELLSSLTDCREAQAAAIYGRGLLSAREAARLGGTVESLADVRSAVHELAWVSNDGRAAAEIASLVLQAAASAAQYERDEMAVFLDEAARIESLQLAAHQPGAPLITAHEVAGELWLQVHRFDDARRAFERAAAQVGDTGRVRLGLARASAHLNDTARACSEYDRVIDWWGARTGEPPEIAEARTYLASRCNARRP